MGAVSPSKVPKPRTIRKRDGDEPVSLYKKGGKVKKMAEGSKVNEANSYTKPSMRKSLFKSIKNSSTQGTAAGQWSARKAQLLAKKYKEKGGGYTD
jgi:hypothetical protein